MNKYMKVAYEESIKNSDNDFREGGPFGAVIVKDGKIIARARNTVVLSNDPTSHAEINAIRNACKKLKTFDLKGCVLYTSCYPCPMCLSSLVWANIKEVYYGNTKEDASEIGFRDDDIYEMFTGNINKIKLTQMDRDVTIDAFDRFKKEDDKITY